MGKIHYTERSKILLNISGLKARAKNNGSLQELVRQIFGIKYNEFGKFVNPITPHECVNKLFLDKAKI